MTEFEEWRVEQACKLIRREEQYLGRQTSDQERNDLLVENTDWNNDQIGTALMAIRLNGGDVTA